MFACASCGGALDRARVSGGLAWVCRACGSRAVTLPVLRRMVDPAALRDLWQRTLVAPRIGERDCPACLRPMLVVDAPAAGGPVALDVCPRCQLVWFDAAEFERLPAGSVPPPPDTTPRGGSSRRPGHDDDRLESPPISGLRVLPALLGMPVELEGGALRTRPIGTWVLAAIVAAVSVLGFVDPAWIERLALVPARAWSGGGIRMLTAFFVHGGVVHLLGNLYFFVTFGDNVEDYLGRARWLALVVAATLVGALFHVLGDPSSRVPCVGASGGISGLIAFYALRFPRARLGSIFWFLFLPQWITYPAWGGFVFWVLSQSILLWQQLAGFGNVSALAHVGGALVGVIAWALWRDP
ncbi:MAG: rhomboid family intramembrane serine protease [Planctomycetes bacterium]|nr:rhomboid family intramembrane serine protease [Planctomycetota bacterium]